MDWNGQLKRRCNMCGTLLDDANAVRDHVFTMHNQVQHYTTLVDVSTWDDFEPEQEPEVVTRLKNMKPQRRPEPEPEEDEDFDEPVEQPKPARKRPAEEEEYEDLSISRNR